MPLRLTLTNVLTAISVFNLWAATRFKVQIEGFVNLMSLALFQAFPVWVGRFWYNPGHWRMNASPKRNLYRKWLLSCALVWAYRHTSHTGFTPVTCATSGNYCARVRLDLAAPSKLRQLLFVCVCCRGGGDPDTWAVGKWCVISHWEHDSVWVETWTHNSRLKGGLTSGRQMEWCVVK